MEYLINEIRVAYSDAMINDILANASKTVSVQASPEGKPPFTMHYSENEDYFVKLHAPIVFPHIQIHHDVRQSQPVVTYIYALRDIVQQLVAVVPEAMRDLSYFFDPAEILKPCFYKIYKVENELYLYLMRIDLLQRPLESETIEHGDNDTTAAFRSDRLYVESEIIPLDAIMWELGRVQAFKIKQLVSQTWIGETGRGYLLHGIWMDADLSRFFSKLLVPQGMRIYPFTPFTCKYKTICCEAPILDVSHRRALIPLLHNALGFLQPLIGTVQEALRHREFSDDMPEFLEIKSKVPEAWTSYYKGLRVRMYLNDKENKEYELDFADH